MKNKFLAAVLSVAIAFALWGYVITVESPGFEGTFTNVPVVLQSEGLLEDRGLMVTKVMTPDVDLRLSGNRTDVNKLTSSNIGVYADVSGIIDAGEHKLSYNYSFPGDVANNAITVQNRDPEFITVLVENRVTKNVDVTAKYLGSLPEELIYDKGNVVFDNTYVSVTGPSSVVDQIASAVVEINLDGRTESFAEQLVYTLCDASGEPVDAELVRTNVDSINVTLKIQRVKEVKLTVKVVEGGGATEKTSSIDIDPATIRISGSDNLLEGLDELEVGTVFLGDLTGAKNLKFGITLPEGVSNVTGFTEATVRIKFPDLAIRTFNITNIVAQNVPADLKAELLTQSLEVRLRGPKDLVNAMKDTDVYAMVDFAGLTAETSTATAAIIVGEDYEGVGALGSYTVSYVLSPDNDRDGN